MQRDLGWLGKRLQGLYRFHFEDARRERMFLSSLGFGAGAATTRVITHMIHHRIGPFRNVSVKGQHIHHLVPGILTLIGTGYAWLLIADDAEKSRRDHRLTSLGYGLGSALTLDEFALWLSLSDVYWEHDGRKSVEAVMFFGAVLSAGLWGAPFLKEASKEIAALLKREARAAAAGT
jgi:hypothetical protein